MISDLSNKSIEELENEYWGEAPKDSSSLVKNCHTLRKKKLVDFEPSDLRILINQDIALKYLIPLALNILKQKPFIETDYFEGDLLKSVISSDVTFWKNENGLKNIVKDIIEKNRKEFDDLDTTEEIKTELLDLFNAFLKY